MWEDNRRSLTSFLSMAHLGVKGLVKNSNGEVIPGALVRVDGNDKVMITSSRGEYWRLLLPGRNYTLVKYNLCPTSNGVMRRGAKGAAAPPCIFPNFAPA